MPGHMTEIQRCRIGDDRARRGCDNHVTGDRPEICAKMDGRFQDKDWTAGRLNANMADDCLVEGLHFARNDNDFHSVDVDQCGRPQIGWIAGTHRSRQCEPSICQSFYPSSTLIRHAIGFAAERQ